MDIYTVINTVQETPDTTTIQFVDSNQSHPDFEPGQFITVQFDDLGVPEGKAYSLSSLPSDPYMAITVKNIGLYSNRLCSLKRGDRFTASKPYGYLFEDTGKPLVCIAAGVGVSPLWSIIRSTLATDADRKISLFCGNKTINDIVFRDAIQEAENTYHNFEVIHHITRQVVNETDYYLRGRIDTDAIYQTIAENDASAIICGSQSFVTDTYKKLIESGIADDQISTEIFFQTAWK